jgi:predicted  nucleic acid-binding Zn-ribbon protein
MLIILRNVLDMSEKEYNKKLLDEIRKIRRDLEDMKLDLEDIKERVANLETSKTSKPFV